MQTAWYDSVAQDFGVALDTRHSYIKSDWEIWTAAIVSDEMTRDTFINSVTAYAADGQSAQPLGDLYDAHSGAVDGFRARPVVGGHLALLVI